MRPDARLVSRTPCRRIWNRPRAAGMPTRDTSPRNHVKLPGCAHRSVQILRYRGERARQKTLCCPEESVVRPCRAARRRKAGSELYRNGAVHGPAQELDGSEVFQNLERGNHRAWLFHVFRFEPDGEHSAARPVEVNPIPQQRVQPYHREVPPDPFVPGESTKDQQPVLRTRYFALRYPYRNRQSHWHTPPSAKKASPSGADREKCRKSRTGIACPSFSAAIDYTR